MPWIPSVALHLSLVDRICSVFPFREFEIHVDAPCGACQASSTLSLVGGCGLESTQYHCTNAAGTQKCHLPSTRIAIRSHHQGKPTLLFPVSSWRRIQTTTRVRPPPNVPILPLSRRAVDIEWERRRTRPQTLSRKGTPSRSCVRGLDAMISIVSTMSSIRA